MQKPIVLTLSANDTGETGAHMAGVYIPKNEEVLSFFPQLDKNKKNPRVSLTFEDQEGKQRKFNFVYYNNKFHSSGTRNEYRLTGMTEFIRSSKLKEGDAIEFSKTNSNKFKIKCHKKSENQVQRLKLRKVTVHWSILLEYE